MGLLSIVMVALAEIFLGINAGRGKNEARAEVNSNLRFAVDKIESDLRAATAVSAPVSTGASSSVLTITNASGTITYCVASSTLYRLSGVNPAVGAWANANALPSILYSHGAVVYNGYMYTIGGFDGTNVTSTVFFAPLNSTGSIGAWSTTQALPSPIYIISAVAYNGFIYTIGAVDSNGVRTSTVFYAPVNSTGSLGAWSTTTPLPNANYYNTAVANNGYVYSIGGHVSGGTSTVLFAPINATGSLGAWTQTASLLAGTQEHASVAYNGYIYKVGGGLTTNVQFASINATGSLGNWTNTTALPSPLQDLSAVVSNGYVYTTGGTTDGTNPTSTVFYAPLNATGSIGAWLTTTQLPSAIRYHTALINNGYIYTIGGNNGSATSTVFYAPFACSGDAITASTVLVNPALFTRLQNTNTVLNKTTVSVQADVVVSYNGTAPEDQYSEEKITTTALRN